MKVIFTLTQPIVLKEITLVNKISNNKKSEYQSRDDSKHKKLIKLKCHILMYII